MNSDTDHVDTPEPVVTLATKAALTTSIESLGTPLALFLADLGLPTQNVLVPEIERRQVIDSLHYALDLLPIEEREKSYYLTKFTVAVSIGLFDAALNYLWNENISSLRKLVASTDLSYFYDVAEKRESYRSRLQGSDSLPMIDDQLLIDTCARVGLLDDVNHERLRHINYMRNHASATHPNQSQLNGAEMLSWLSNSIRYVIISKPDTPAMEIKRLLHNLRRFPIPDGDVPVMSSSVQRLPSLRIDDLLWTVFGMYVDPTTDTVCRENIAKLAKTIWQCAGEDRRFEVGSRYAHFLAHNDQDRKLSANDFLQRVGGLQYRSDEILAVELLDKLRTLHNAHLGLNNFYNEWPHAATLATSLPTSGAVPRPARHEWVSVICQCYVGNGHGHRQGVDEQAVPYYERFIDAFGNSEIVEFLRLFGDATFTVDFAAAMAEARVRSLATRLKRRAGNVFVVQALDLVIGTPPGTLRGLAGTASFRRALDNVPDEH